MNRSAGLGTLFRSKWHSRARSIGALALSGSLLLIFGCGGSNETTPTGGGSGTMSGRAVYGQMSNAAVNAYGVSNGAVGAQLGSTTTDAQGNFSVSIGSYSGPVMLQVSGGTYTDDATGTSMTMQPGDVMTGVVPSVAAGSSTSGIQVTPLTSMAQVRAQNMAGGMTDANINSANAAVGSYFSVSDLLHTSPMDPLSPGSGSGATQGAKNHGMTIAAMSQYAATLGMPHSSGVITAMMDDVLDGVLDGKMGGTSISMSGMGGMMGGGMMQANAGTSGLSNAMTQFMTSAMNKSGVTVSDMQPLINQLGGSSGTLPGVSGTGGGTVSGTAIYGPMSGGTMTAFAVTGGAMGAQLGSTTTDAHGNFTVSIGSYAGPVMLQMGGGTYTDDATGTTMTMQAGDVMTAVLGSVAAGSSTAGIQVTPLTSMARARAQNTTGGMTDANIASASAAVGSYFSVSDILHTSPMDPLSSGSGSGATQDAKNYGMTIAAMSQYAATIGMPHTSGVITAMAEDASDGVMDGKMGGTSISMSGMGGMMGGGMMQASAGTSGMAAAMTTFIEDTAENKSGVSTTDMQQLIAKLNTSNGTIQ
jgi:hypothetical protein